MSPLSLHVIDYITSVSLPTQKVLRYIHLHANLALLLGEC